MTKEQIIAAIKAKYPAVNLTTKRLDEIAARLLPKVTDATTLDAKLDDLNDFHPFADIAKNDDKIADLQIKLKTASTKPPKEKEEEKPEDKPKPDDENIPSWMRSYMEKQDQKYEAQSQLLGKLVADKTTATISEKLKTDKRLENVPAYILDLAGVPTEENYESHVENIVAKVTAAQANDTNNNFTQVPKPIGSNQKVDISTIKPATKEELDSVFKEIK